MNIHNIHTIARYEVKLLKRSWLFRIFTILAFFGITIATMSYLTPIFGHFQEIWPREAVASQFPFFPNMLYNIAQSVIAVFLAGNFLKRDKKLDTAEVIYVRPMSNADYVIGKTLGIVEVFFSLNIIVLIIAAFFNIVIAKSPFSLFPYLFYLFTISLPSLLFVLGLSFVAMCLLKNQAVTFVVMLGIIGVVFFYIKDACFGVFDFFGVNIPTAFSEITGHSDLSMFLLQRTAFLLAGAGLICFTIALVNRLPHKPWKIIIVNTLGTFLIIAGISTSLLYTFHYFKQLEKRNNYIETFNQYAGSKFVNTVSHKLTITPVKGGLEGISQMEVENRNKERIDEIILYLNPSLTVSSIKNEGKETDFKQIRQVITIPQSLESGERARLTLQYQGKIDETICYTDVLETEYLDNSNPQGFSLLGKKYAWTESEFTLLTPECLWYPVSIPGVNPAAPYNIQKDFTQYELTVNYDGDKTVLSQGEAHQNNGSILFTPDTPLPGISLTIADYDKKFLTVDSVSFEIYHFKGHDFFSKHFEELKDTLPGLIREFKNDIEIELGRDYPFHRFILAETPAQHHSYVRNWKGYSEYVMPEIIFVPERGIVWNADIEAQIFRAKNWRRPNRGMEDPIETKIEILRSYLRNRFIEENTQYGWDWENKLVNKFNIKAMLYNHTGFIQSDEYPVLDITLNTMQSTTNERTFPWMGIINDKQRANLYLETHSFKHAISDTELKPVIFYEMLKLKSAAIRNYVYTQTTQEDFQQFLKDFFHKHQFTTIPFDTFKEAFEQRYSIQLDKYLSQWYNEDHSPTVFIKDVNANEVVINEETKYKISFKLYNPSDVDAVITAKIQQGGGDFRGGPGRGGRGGFGTTSDNPTDNYLLPASTAKEIRMIVDERPANLEINTNISHNLPTTHRFNFPKIDNETTDTTTGNFTIDPAIFKPDPKEIIVDNEDSGFRTIASNTKHKLKDLFQKEEEEKYKNFVPWWMPSKWTAMAADYCYGESIRSAVYKSQGRGNNSVEWSTDIPKSGYYEISVWNPKMTGPMFGPRRHRGKEERNQTYTIRYGEEEESITLDMEMEDEGWRSLGNFYLPDGKVTITLTDKVDGSYVIADAVKFTLSE